MFLVKNISNSKLAVDNRKPLFIHNLIKKKKGKRSKSLKMLIFEHMKLKNLL